MPVPELIWLPPCWAETLRVASIETNTRERSRFIGETPGRPGDRGSAGPDGKGRAAQRCAETYPGPGARAGPGFTLAILERSAARRGELSSPFQCQRRAEWAREQRAPWTIPRAREQSR